VTIEEFEIREADRLRLSIHPAMICDTRIAKARTQSGLGALSRIMSRGHSG